MELTASNMCSLVGIESSDDVMLMLENIEQRVGVFVEKDIDEKIDFLANNIVGTSHPPNPWIMLKPVEELTYTAQKVCDKLQVPLTDTDRQCYKVMITKAAVHIDFKVNENTGFPANSECIDALTDKLHQLCFYCNVPYPEPRYSSGGGLFAVMQRICYYCELHGPVTIPSAVKAAAAKLNCIIPAGPLRMQVWRLVEVTNAAPNHGVWDWIARSSSLGGKGKATALAAVPSNGAAVPSNGAAAPSNGAALLPKKSVKSKTPVKSKKSV